MSATRLIIGILALVMGITTAMAQQEVVRFIYDDAGNRELRWIEITQLKHTDSLPFETLDEGVELADETLLSPESEPTRVYPNPVHGLLTVDMPGKASGAVQYLLYDLHGRLVMEGELQQNVSTIDMRPLQNGAYYLILNDNGRQERFRLIKQG